MSPRLFSCFALFGFLAVGMTGRAQESERKAPRAEAAEAGNAAVEKMSVPEGSVKKVGETVYRIGEVEFDAKTREIRFPVTVNMREGGPIEYLLVQERGKVHESIFTTVVSPLSLQVAMKLLHYQSGYGDVFNRLLRSEVLEKEGGTEADRGDSVIFTFQAEGGEKAVPVYEFVIDGESAEAMTPGGWIYTGSVVDEGTFMAEAEGSIIAIYLDHLALFNMTREGADVDERWGARSTTIPEIGTKGSLVIQPFVEPDAAGEK